MLQIAWASIIGRGGLAQPLEPPCTDPYARWCGRGQRATAAPMPINVLYVSSNMSRGRANFQVPTSSIWAGGQRYLGENNNRRNIPTDLRGGFDSRDPSGDRFGSPWMKMTSDTIQGPLRPGRSVPFDFGRVLCDGHGAYFVPCLICRMHARTSRTNVSGCSNAAKCPPFSSSLK